MAARDKARFVGELNTSLPDGTSQRLKDLDDSDRVIKTTLVNSFPNINNQVLYSTAELNDLKDNLVHTSNEFDFKNNAIKNVVTADDDSAVQPRSYNDSRYAQTSNNLSDLQDQDIAIENLFNGASLTGVGIEHLITTIMNKVYPVGRVIHTESTANPHDELGVGIWQLTGQGRVIVGAGHGIDGKTSKDFRVNEAGGEYNHTLSVDEMPSHNHKQHAKTVVAVAPFADEADPISGHSSPSGHLGRNYTENTGGDKPHNNMQPYLVLYRWKRIQ